MSSTKKVFRKALVIAAVAAIVWFTVGAGAGAVATPAAGSGSIMTAEVAAGTGMTTAATGATVAGEAVAVGSAAVGAEGVAVTSALAPGTLAPAATGAALPGYATAAELSAANIAGTTTAQALSVAPAATSSGFLNSAGAWVTANPVPATILGMGAFGAAEAALADDNRVDSRDFGTGGYSRGGTYAAPQTGIVQTQRQQEEQKVNSTQLKAPIVAGQMNQSQNQEVAQNRPVDRKNLPKLQKQGLVAQQKQQQVV